MQKANKSKGTDVEAPAGPADTSLVPRDQRPQHRLGMVPFIGKKVDTIEWAREEIRVCTELLEEGRRIIEKDGGDKGNKDVARVSDEDGGNRSDSMDRLETAAGSSGHAKKGGDDKPVGGTYPPLNSAFITFNRQIAAHLGKQVLTHHEPYRMSESTCSITHGVLVHARPF